LVGELEGEGDGCGGWVEDLDSPLISSFFFFFFCDEESRDFSEERDKVDFEEALRVTVGSHFSLWIRR
jgi:hypothetical protein